MCMFKQVHKKVNNTCKQYTLLITLIFKAINLLKSPGHWYLKSSYFIDKRLIFKSKSLNEVWKYPLRNISINDALNLYNVEIMAKDQLISPILLLKLHCVLTSFGYTLIGRKRQKESINKIKLMKYKKVVTVTIITPFIMR